MSVNLIERIGAICDEDRPFDVIAGEVCTLIRRGLPHHGWVGVYMVEEPETLVLKAWDGPQATEHVRIPIGQGICGLAAREDRTVVVDDVRKDSRYLQCFLHTRAEIVVPIRARGAVVGEVDIDSDREAAFSATDAMFVEWVALRLGRAFERSR